MLKIIHFYHFDSDPRFPPFLLNVRWKSGVTFVRRYFRDETGLQCLLGLICLKTWGNEELKGYHVNLTTNWAGGKTNLSLLVNLV